MIEFIDILETLQRDAVFVGVSMNIEISLNHISLDINNGTTRIRCCYTKVDINSMKCIQPLVDEVIKDIDYVVNGGAVCK